VCVCVCVCVYVWRGGYYTCIHIGMYTNILFILALTLLHTHMHDTYMYMRCLCYIHTCMIHTCTCTCAGRPRTSRRLGRHRHVRSQLACGKEQPKSPDQSCRASSVWVGGRCLRQIARIYRCVNINCEWVWFIRVCMCLACFDVYVCVYIYIYIYWG
jgi:hypothetical protein